MGQKNLVCQPFWPNPVPTTAQLPDAISCQISVEEHLLMNGGEGEKEKQNLGHREVEKRNDRGEQPG